MSLILSILISCHAASGADECAVRESVITPVWSGAIDSWCIERYYSEANKTMRVLARDEAGRFELIYCIASNRVTIHRMPESSAGYVWQGYDDAGTVVSIGLHGDLRCSTEPHDRQVVAERLGFDVRWVNERWDIPAAVEHGIQRCIFRDPTRGPW